MTGYIVLNAILADKNSGFSMKEILLLIACALFIFLIFYLPVAWQTQLSNSVDDWKYRRVRFTPFSALFRTVCGEKVSKYGLVPTLFIVQLVGYILSVCCTVTLFVLLTVMGKREGVQVAVLVSGCILVAELVIDALVITCVSRHSKRIKSQYATREEAKGYYYIKGDFKYNVYKERVYSQKDIKRNRINAPPITLTKDELELFNAKESQESDTAKKH